MKPKKRKRRVRGLRAEVIAANAKIFEQAKVIARLHAALELEQKRYMSYRAEAEVLRSRVARNECLAREIASPGVHNLRLPWEKEAEA